MSSCTLLQSIYLQEEQETMKTSTKKWLAIACAMTLHASFVSASAQDAMEAYNNTRFGYHVNYPKVLLRPLPESDNGDGRAFQPLAGHAKILVWGGWIMPDVEQTLKGRARSALKDCGGKVSYQLHRPGFEVLSCVLPDGDIFYTKIEQDKGEVVGLELTYPQSEKDRWDLVAAAMAKSLDILGPPTPM